jgi:biopolymer transport protein ExbB
MPMLQKYDNHFFFSFFRYSCWIVRNCAGMIKAFGALAAGTPDQAALAAGISEALITATGIGTSAVAIISYFFTKIDDLTYSIDEAAVSIVNT